MAHKFLTKLITSPEWAELPDDIKADAIDDVMRKTRDVGRMQTMMLHPDLILKIATEKAKKAGLTPAKFQGVP